MPEVALYTLLGFLRFMQGAGSGAACYRGTTMGERDSRDPRDAAAGGAGAPDGARAFDSKGWLADTTGEMRESFARNRRVMSFAEYFALFGADPRRQLRSAAVHARLFDHFGTEAVRTRGAR